MRKSLVSRFTVGAVAAAAITALLAVVCVAPAGAAVTTKTNKVCKALASVGDVSNSSSSGIDTSNLKQVAKNLKKASNSASGKIKSALKTLATGYASIAKASGKVDQATAAAQFFTKSDFRKAIQTFITYYTKNCATLSVPTT